MAADPRHRCPTLHNADAVPFLGRPGYGAGMSRQTSGITLITLSFVLWGLALSAPFLPLALAAKAVLGIGLYGLSYVVFGLGCTRIGGAAWPMIKRRIWRSRRTRTDP